ncbi:hypothetical protein RI367_004759 [Sorochytrium milnesiophthora]
MASPPAEHQQRSTGRVKFFNSVKGYGFVILDGQPGCYDNVEVFVHHTAIVASPTVFHSLAEGEQVEFDLFCGPKGYFGQNVTGPNGAMVHGDYKAQHQQQQQYSVHIPSSSSISSTRNGNQSPKPLSIGYPMYVTHAPFSPTGGYFVHAVPGASPPPPPPPPPPPLPHLAQTLPPGSNSTGVSFAPPSSVALSHAIHRSGQLGGKSLAGRSDVPPPQFAYHPYYGPVTLTTIPLPPLSQQQQQQPLSSAAAAVITSSPLPPRIAPPPHHVALYPPGLMPYVHSPTSPTTPTSSMMPLPTMLPIMPPPPPPPPFIQGRPLHLSGGILRPAEAANHEIDASSSNGDTPPPLAAPSAPIAFKLHDGLHRSDSGVSVSDTTHTEPATLVQLFDYTADLSASPSRLHDAPTSSQPSSAKQ